MATLCTLSGTRPPVARRVGGWLGGWVGGRGGREGGREGVPHFSHCYILWVSRQPEIKFGWVSLLKTHIVIRECIELMPPPGSHGANLASPVLRLRISLCRFGVSRVESAI